jgi:hypothetical protein
MQSRGAPSLALPRARGREWLLPVSSMEVGTPGAGTARTDPPLCFPTMQGASRKPADELLALRNIGPAMRRDFTLLGIRSVRQLARCRADRLYEKLQALTGQRQDPCVLDTFAAAIHQAKTGEALSWWHFSRIRKRATASPATAPRGTSTR